MTRMAMFAASSVSPALTMFGGPLAAQGRPSIVTIFGDDIGWMNVSSYGCDIMGVQTPHIDRIAREGLRLTSVYTQTRCMAGRAAIITGQLPVRTGLTTVGPPGSPAGLQTEDITLAEILKARGYATARDDQLGLSADVGRTIEGIQSRILKIQRVD
jgi:arylsulfatase A-like enzyme